MELTEKKLQELKEKKISIEELNEEYFVRFKYGSVEVDNISRLLNENICSFQQIVDKFKNIKDYWSVPSLYKLLRNREFFKELIENNKLNEDDLRSLLSTIDNRSELNDLCNNTPLLKYILNEFVLNKELVDRLNIILENDEECKNYDIYTIFDLIEHYIEYFNKRNKEIPKLSELNKKVCLLSTFDLNKDQKSEIAKVLEDNEIARNRLVQIINNHVESNYDFNSLMDYLKKPEKKSILSI